MSHYNNLHFQLTELIDIKIGIYLIEKHLHLLDIEIAKIKEKIMQILASFI